MIRQFPPLAALLAGVLILTGCGEADGAADEVTDTATVEEQTTAPPPTPDATDAPDAGTVVAVSESDLGEIIVDGAGRTLYLLTADPAGESGCTDDCAAAWPPLSADGEAAAGEGVDAGLLGTTEREDGTMQVTYGDSPLYYFQGDETAGEVNGQGIESFGGTWWVVAPTGEPITDDAATPAGGGISYGHY